MPKFTKRYIDSLQVKEKPYEVWDSEIRGFGCMIYPSGRKTYYFLYRYRSGRKERLKVGIHGNITCEIGREISKGWAGDLARGINPKENNKKLAEQEKYSITIDSFLTLFMERYKKIHNKESTNIRDNYRIKNIIIPFLGDKKILDINREDILKFQDHLKNTPIQFNRCNSLLSKAFNIAELWGYRLKNSNPCHGIQKYKERKKERFLTSKELHKLNEVLKTQEAIGETSSYSLAAIRILVYTGCRLSEVLTLKWENVFLNESYFHLRDSKTGEKKIPLNESAKSVLIKIKQHKKNSYVFAGNKPGTCLTTLTRAWIKIRRLANLEDVRLHDLRHTFASSAIKQGIDLYTVSKLLGHKNIYTTTRYSHLAMDQLIEATNKIDQIWQEENKKL